VPLPPLAASWPLPRGARVLAPPPARPAAPRAEIEVEVPVEHGLLVENLLDLAHAPFTHTSTFARGWPVRQRLGAAPAGCMHGVWSPPPPPTKQPGSLHT
jgi:chlorophyllide a oxygenase